MKCSVVSLMGAVLVSCHTTAAQRCSGTQYISPEEADGGVVNFYDDADNTMPYANNADCKWMISCPVGMYATVLVHTMATEVDLDKLEVYDWGPTQRSNTCLLQRVSGPYSPRDARGDGYGVSSNTHTLWVTFTSDSSTTGAGFWAHAGCTRTCVLTTCHEGARTANACPAASSDDSSTDPDLNAENKVSGSVPSGPYAVLLAVLLLPALIWSD